MDAVEEFNVSFDKILAKDNLVIKPLFSLDTNVYKFSALGSGIKELMGLVASMILRCDDCVKFHREKSAELGITKEQLFETFSIAYIVGGAIVIPHLPRAVDYCEILENKE